MPLSAALLDFAERKGLSVSDLKELVEIMSECVQTAPIKTARQMRNARYYQRKKASESVLITSADCKTPIKTHGATDLVGAKAVSLIPPRDINQPPTSLPKKSDTARGTRLPADWQPSEADRAYALGKGASAAMIDLEAEKFRNFWLAKTGIGATKRDWAATWRNWILSALERARPRAGPEPRKRSFADIARESLENEHRNYDDRREGHASVSRLDAAGGRRNLFDGSGEDADRRPAPLLSLVT